MAGGTTNRPGRTPLGQRTRVELGHTTVPRSTTHVPGPGPDYGETATYRTPPDGPCHVWVDGPDGRQPGLLLEWRKPAQLPWEGLVRHPALVGGRWLLVSRWWPAGAVERT